VALGNAFNGVELHGATNALIGGADPAGRNVISGNARSGVFVTGSGSGNRIQGNYAGTDVTGLHALANGFHGVAISGASGVTVGGSASGEGNLLSGNLGTGLSFFEGAHDNLVQGNLVGTDRTGMTALGNRFSGIASSGISFTAASSNNLVAGNWIGVDVSGSASVPNAANGIHVFGASNVTISGNVISGNGTSFGAAGIRISNGASGTRVQGNF